MNSIGGGIAVQKRCARVRPVRLRSAIEELAVLEVSGGVGRHEGALRDHPFSIASQRFENAVCQPRSVPLAGQLLRHLRAKQGEAAFSRRLRARRRRKGFSSRFIAGLSRIPPRQAGRAVCRHERRRMLVLRMPLIASTALIVKLRITCRSCTRSAWTVG